MPSLSVPLSLCSLFFLRSPVSLPFPHPVSLRPRFLSRILSPLPSPLALPLPLLIALPLPLPLSLFSILFSPASSLALAPPLFPPHPPPLEGEEMEPSPFPAFSLASFLACALALAWCVCIGHVGELERSERPSRFSPHSIPHRLRRRTSSVRRIVCYNSSPGVPFSVAHAHSHSHSHPHSLSLSLSGREKGKETRARRRKEER